MSMGLSQSFNNTEKRYRELQAKVESLGGGSAGLGNINKKAMDMKKEAEELQKKANKGLEQLRSEYSKLYIHLQLIKNLLLDMDNNRLSHKYIHFDSVPYSCTREIPDI